jgi:general secretion pathway protein D
MGGMGMGGGGGFGGNFGYPAYGGYQAQVPVQAVIPGGLIGAGQTAPAAAPAAGGTTGTTGQQENPPRVVPNPLDNSLLIQATKSQYQGILKLLRELDRPPRQILLEAKIFSVAMTNGFSSGINAYFQKVTSSTRQPFGSATERTALGALQGGTLTLSAGTLVGQSRELLAFLSLQENASNARVISEPSLIATDSIPAVINVGTQVPVLTGQYTNPAITGGTTTQGISSHNTGVTLQVNARVNPSGVVTLIVNQEVSSPAQNTTSSIDTPAFDQQVVQTQITLQDGDTIAIGGTISENTTNATLGIPGLSRIPFLGSLFGSRQYTRDRSELIIFMTPHVIYDTTDLLEASEEVKARMRKLRKYVNE